ncbi:MAG: hypothetical protein H6774_01750 [Pseudomonadales bacterium]|nr:hypothetical protein [Candidatus Woesebacteria bacterium]MCB9801790.1 hypothetical protein [Pseudomonadales bacterium]
MQRTKHDREQAFREAVDRLNEGELVLPANLVWYLMENDLSEERRQELRERFGHTHDASEAEEEKKVKI